MSAEVRMRCVDPPVQADVPGARIEGVTHYADFASDHDAGYLPRGPQRDIDLAFRNTHYPVFDDEVHHDVRVRIVEVLEINSAAHEPLKVTTSDACARSSISTMGA